MSERGCCYGKKCNTVYAKRATQGTLEECSLIASVAFWASLASAYICWGSLVLLSNSDHKCQQVVTCRGLNVESTPEGKGKPPSPRVWRASSSVSSPDLGNPSAFSSWVSLSHVWLLATPWMNCSPARLLCLWNSPGKSTGVGCHSLLQGIFLTPESNPGTPAL